MGSPEGKRPFGRPRHRWEDSIKMDLQKVGGGMGRTDLAQDRDRWWVVVNAVMNLRVPYHGVILFDITRSFSVHSLLAHLIRTDDVMTGIYRLFTYSHFLSAFSFVAFYKKKKITEMSLVVQGELFQD